MQSTGYDICIIGGAGRIGLPLGITFASAGKKVILLDRDKDRLQRISQGEMPYMEEGAQELLEGVIGKNLFVSSDDEVIGESHFIVIVIGTPVDEYLTPKFTVFKNLILNMMHHINDGHHIILRSTLYPETTVKVKKLLEESGKNTRVSFCPERIAEGKAISELRSLPQIVSSFDEAATAEASALFESINDEIVVLEPLEAELAKLFTNSWRYIQFAISNQFYLIASEKGLDFNKIYDAMRHKYPRAKNIPAPGFTAGPCLLKDTMQLATFCNNTFFLGHAAMLVNEGIPNFIVAKLKEKHGIDSKVVGILGMAFKGDSDDPRDSLSYKLKKLLEIEAARVVCTDPYVADPSFVPADECVRQSDILVLGAPHSVYRDLDIDFKAKVVIDIWNFFGVGGPI